MSYYNKYYNLIEATFYVFRRLQGVIGWKYGAKKTSHFVAYCRRLRWEVHDDLTNKIQTITNLEITLDAAIYIREVLVQSYCITILKL